MRLLTWGIGLMMALGCMAAHADPMQTISLSGKLSYGNDTSNLFSSNKASLTSDSYSLTFSYDPLQLSGVSCSYSADCTWNFTTASNAEEVVTINGKTQTFTGSTGTINFCACGNGDAINITLDGTTLTFQANLPAVTSLFKSQTNVDNTELLNSISNSPLSGASFENKLDNTDFGASGVPISISTGLALPEPISLAAFGAGLFGLGVVRRTTRRKTSTV
jgi:hypothetical protein